MAFIECKKAIKEIRDTYEYEYPTASGAFDEFVTMLIPRILNNIPPADVAEVVHAKWEISSDGYYPYCSHCKTEPENGVMSKYCPECGAKMDKERNDT